MAYQDIFEHNIIFFYKEYMKTAYRIGIETLR